MYGLILVEPAGGLPKVDLCPLNDNSGDEGTAMLEIVHDMAPSAALAFCPAFGDAGQQGLADAVTWLATEAFGGKGADVIVDDVGFLTEPFFQDGVIAQAVDAAVARWRVVASRRPAAPPTRTTSTPTRTSSPATTSSSVRHPRLRHRRRSPPDIGWDGLVAGNGNFFAAFMQWNDPFGGSANDYDIYIFDADGDLAGDPASDFPIGGSGFDVQDGDDDPMEVAFVVNRHRRRSAPSRVLHGHRPLLRRPGQALELQFNRFFAVDRPRTSPRAASSATPPGRGALAVAATGAVETSTARRPASTSSRSSARADRRGSSSPRPARPRRRCATSRTRPRSTGHR
jgi:hypothetical protein